jgi:hypothetical protein
LNHDKLTTLLPAEPNGPPAADFKGYVVIETARRDPVLAFVNELGVWTPHEPGAVDPESILRHTALPDIPDLLAKLDAARQQLAAAHLLLKVTEQEDAEKLDALVEGSLALSKALPPLVGEGYAAHCRRVAEKLLHAELAGAVGPPLPEDAVVPVLRCGRCEEEFLGEEGKTYEHGVICPLEKGNGLVGVCTVVRHVTRSEAACLRAAGKKD